MNELEKELIDYQYKNETIRQYVRIYKRTKKKRIKNKVFSKLMFEAIKERKIIKGSGVVILDIQLYKELEKLRSTCE